MLHTTGERTMEKYNIFPYLAWATLIGFALFVYLLAIELKAAAENLNQSTSRLESIIQEPLQRETLNN